MRFAHRIRAHSRLLETGDDTEESGFQAGGKGSFVAKSQSTEPPTYGTVIRDLRMACGLSQEQLAARIAASVSTISLTENEGRRLSYDMAMAVCSALGLPTWIPVFLEYYHDKMEHSFTCRNDESGFPEAVLDIQSRLDKLDALVAQNVSEIFRTIQGPKGKPKTQTRSEQRRQVIAELRERGKRRSPGERKKRRRTSN